MNKKFLMVAFIPLVLSLMVTPVMAIGPHNAEKNPHRTELAPGEVEFLLPSGVTHGWGGIMDHRHIKDASRFSIPKAPTLTADDLINVNSGDLTYENKWCMLPLQAILDAIDLMVSWGAIPEDVGELMKAEFVATFPEGYYLMFVNVGE
jgi:hypothetical protein